jgi:glycosyltransferase involved in cell wall biosynthesis
LAVGFVGRFTPQKNPRLLLRAFAELASVNPQARLVMVGDGPLKPELESLAQSLKISHRVMWTGFMEGRRAMAGFDLLALPSDYEGFPYVLLEALNAGLPVVTTAVGGTEMVVEDRQNGLVVPVGDTAAFAHALEALAVDPELRQRFASSSSKRAVEFSQERMVERTLGLYRQLLS